MNGFANFVKSMSMQIHATSEPVHTTVLHRNLRNLASTDRPQSTRTVRYSNTVCAETGPDCDTRIHRDIGRHRIANVNLIKIASRQKQYDGKQPEEEVPHVQWP